MLYVFLVDMPVAFIKVNIFTIFIEIKIPYTINARKLFCVCPSEDRMALSGV